MSKGIVVSTPLEIESLFECGVCQAEVAVDCVNPQYLLELQLINKALREALRSHPHQEQVQTIIDSNLPSSCHMHSQHRKK